MKDKCGTPAFMAPEQHEIPRSPGYSFPADLFAAGTCLWCILHGGEHPYMVGPNLDLQSLLVGQPQFRGNSGFWGGSKWSANAQLLCDNLTNRDPAARLTSREALQHQWFRDWDGKISKRMAEAEKEQRKNSRPTQPSPPSTQDNTNEFQGFGIYQK